MQVSHEIFDSVLWRFVILLLVFVGLYSFWYSIHLLSFGTRTLKALIVFVNLIFRFNKSKLV